MCDCFDIVSFAALFILINVFNVYYLTGIQFYVERVHLVNNDNTAFKWNFEFSLLIFYLLIDFMIIYLFNSSPSKCLYHGFWQIIFWTLRNRRWWSEYRFFFNFFLAYSKDNWPLPCTEKHIHCFDIFWQEPHKLTFIFFFKTIFFGQPK